jgi:tRNA uridine 5-carbamoylmethylation protein Kti12
MPSPFVIVIAGPAGVGKTTLSNRLSKHFNCTNLSEDETAKEVFPDVYKDIESYPEKLKKAKNQLLKKANEIFDSGGCVVIDMINLDRGFIEEIKKTFDQHLILRVLYPPMETAIERDKRREGWTSGEDTIRRFYKKYEELKLIIGEKNYIDNRCQTPEKTLERLIDVIEQPSSW